MQGREQTRFRCMECGKLTAGRMPRHGDGSLRYPRRHWTNGAPCPGVAKPAEWVEEPRTPAPASPEAP